MENTNDIKTVMITGATGYVAGWIVRRLLEAGLTVHAPVRDPNDAGKRAYLDAIAAQTPGAITYFKADLLEAGSYEEAMQGCEIVFHTASPFVISVADPQKQLIAPALEGTRNVLETANRTPTVRRVVLTSSCAAIYGDNADLEPTAAGAFTESDWNQTSSLAHQPYSYSKTLAEREAWKLNARQQRWDLVVINPSLVIGPGINPRGTSESFNLIRQLGDGTMKHGAPVWGMGVVDVRDLAEAHFRAAFTPSAAGRYIISGHNTDFLGLAGALSRHFGSAFAFPKRALPKWLVWMVGPMSTPGMTRKMIRRNVNYPWRADHSKSVRELGMTYRPMEASIVDFFQQMIDAGTLATAR